MIANLLHRYNNTPQILGNTTLLDEDTFYDTFLLDLRNCASEVIIESPFVTCKRLMVLMPVLQMLKSKRVRVAVNTRDPREQDNDCLRTGAYEAIARLQHIGVQVVFTEGHHRKLAILDREILYEGSLNILSQSNSCEVMRRIVSVQLAWQMIGFTKLDKILT